MRVQVAIPEAHVSKPVLDSALEATTRLDESMIRGGEVPPFDPTNPGVRWKAEPPGQEHFDHALMVSGRGWGDCDDLAPWRAASLRVTGEDPGARAVVKRSGKKRWHAVVQRSDGSIDDPSIDAGMLSRGRGAGIHGAWVPVMGVGGHSVGSYLERPQLALRPVRDQMGQVEAWQSRADLPWHWRSSRPSPTDTAMVSLHSSPVADQAVVGACAGIVGLADVCGVGDEDHLDRLDAIADAVSGASWEELADEYGPEHADAAGHIVGSFFGGLVKAVTKPVRSVAHAVTHPVSSIRHAVTHPFQTLYEQATLPFGGSSMVKKLAPTALPIAERVLNFVPGVGPVASMALHAASPTLQRLIASGGHLRPTARAAYQQAWDYAQQQAPQYAQQYAAQQPSYGYGGYPQYGGAYSFR